MTKITFSFRKFLAVLLCAVTALTVISVPASADMGPKPSVIVEFLNLGDEVCYGTLLSLTKTTGPDSVWNGVEEDGRYIENGYEYTGTPYKIWKAFVDYKDPDGYYFLQETWNVGESKKISWTYYPPSNYKILLYFPEKNAFVSSGIYKSYAFDSYYTVDMEGVDVVSEDYDDTDPNNKIEAEGSYSNERIKAYNSYKFQQELLSMLARIVATIILELGVALIFGFRKKKEFLFVAVVNVATQILLNVGLNVINYYMGSLAFTVFYVLLEIIIFIAEAVLYSVFLNKFSEKQRKKWFFVLYSFVSNAVSFAAGLFLASVIPGIF